VARCKRIAIQPRAFPLREEFGSGIRAAVHGSYLILCFKAGNGVCRIAFAFDPERSAILLVAGDKSGVSQKRFYRSLIDRADYRFDDHLNTLTDKRKEAKHGTDA
jgi:hypothetical protein